MPTDAIPDSVRRFVFDHVDSVEQLEVLLHLWRGKGRSFSAAEVYEALRTNQESVQIRLEMLVATGLVAVSGEGEARRYAYSPRTHDDDELLVRLEETYRVRRYSLLELLFSPLKRGRTLAEAFRLGRSRKGDDGAGG